MRVQQLVDDVGVVARDGLAHLGSGVAAGQGPGDLQQPVQHRLVPGRRVAMRRAHERELLMRVVDERAQLPCLLAGEGGAEDLIHVLAHHARAVAEDVYERLVLAVQVAHEVLGALGQVEDGLQIDDLGEHGLLAGKLLGKQAEVLEVRIGVPCLHCIRCGHGGPLSDGPRGVRRAGNASWLESIPPVLGEYGTGGKPACNPAR